ncbi:metallo-beta-lactamase superfamily protein [Aspergillus costaricaensis CBS 115574]|uniref:Metallo-beta-lactamase superfamily protein n=1 Tax=Aspergillus costaricaensis CBS 115574 TaxID=1448317 RepID=A0ACD1IBT5_9EURO|nr:metallo-beta-lactamase superfamily protein [Aspergillus costaricaensis CBS 115574]RAK87820.1 metallo-beta-lactamase superfamily protein [Aspergillus costaricaensis CBS 115574]
MAPLTLPENMGSTVDVSIIHAGRTIVPTAYVVQMPISGHDVLDMPCYSFLIENKGLNKRVLFDLGLRKDWKEKLPLPTHVNPLRMLTLIEPKVLQQIESAKAYVEIKQDVACQLRNANVPLESINAIIWSHHHMDHTGDPSLFPPSTNLVVGPGFKHNNTTFPGYPANPDALVTEDAFIGRSLVELDFSGSMAIGDFLAIDFFQDGSLYLLKSNGHTHNHISALARTSKDRFIFLGGDIAHHPGEYRPTKHLPLPIKIRPSPLERKISSNSACPGSVFEAISSANLRGSDVRVTPFYNLNAAMNENLEDAEIALEKLLQFDGSASVMVVTAHDASLLEVLPFFPRKITDWDVKGYKAEGTWRFLKDFAGAIDGTTDKST